VLEDTIRVQLRVRGCFADQARQAIVVQPTSAFAQGPRGAAALDRDEMTYERGRRNRGVEANDDLVGPLLAASDADGFPTSLERQHDRCAFSRIVEPEYQLGESIQEEVSLPHGTDKVMRARVVRVGRNSAWVVREDEDVPRLASLRRRGANMQSMLVSGDLVDVRPLADGSVVVDRVYRRSFELRRHTAGGRTKIMAANIDTFVIVAAVVDPPVRLSMIDQLVASAELAQRAVLLLLTKVDLTDGTRAASILALYRSIGYRALVLQPRRGEGIAELRAALGGVRGLLIGQSGVGKSSIFRALGGATEVGEVSGRGRGRQTTTAARLLRLGSGFLIDSPGVGAFELTDVPPRDVARGFVEFGPLAEGCRFRDCAHITEPGCAVRRMVEEGRVASSRYESYRLIVARADPLSGYV
jgi:ribosome biogenesis GTPase